MPQLINNPRIFLAYPGMVLANLPTVLDLEVHGRAQVYSMLHDLQKSADSVSTWPVIYVISIDVYVISFVVYVTSLVVYVTSCEVNIDVYVVSRLRVDINLSV